MFSEFAAWCRRRVDHARHGPEPAFLTWSVCYGFRKLWHLEIRASAVYPVRWGAIRRPISEGRCRDERCNRALRDRDRAQGRSSRGSGGGNRRSLGALAEVSRELCSRGSIPYASGRSGMRRRVRITAWYRVGLRSCGCHASRKLQSSNRSSTWSNGRSPSWFLLHPAWRLVGWNLTRSRCDLGFFPVPAGGCEHVVGHARRRVRPVLRHQC